MEFFALPAAEQEEFERLVSDFERVEEHVLELSVLRPAIYTS